jgi:hypothetical protein
MNVPRSLAAMLGIGCLVFGSVMSGGIDRVSGQDTLVIAGAIIIAGVLICLAIVESRKG